jgi:hypothetical protein
MSRMPQFPMRIALLSLLAIGPTVSMPALARPEEIRTVWRADGRPPAEVFQHGLTGRGSDIGVLGHVLAGRCDDSPGAQRSAWVSMTADSGQARSFAASRLHYAGASGPGTPLWVYEIRPDSSFVSVPGILRQAIDAAQRGMHGYVPAHAERIRFLMNRTGIGWSEVLARRVPASNIARATPVWLVDGDIREGVDIVNPAYVDADTQALHTVDDLRTYVPIAAVGAEYPRDAPSCAMSCDNASSAPGREHASRTFANPDGFCAAYPRTVLTPEKLMIILD